MSEDLARAALDSTRRLNPGFYLDRWWYSISDNERIGWLVVFVVLLLAFLLRKDMDPPGGTA